MKGTAYLVQATLISLWWLGLFTSKEFFNAFQFPTISPVAFKSFMLPDLITIALLSTIRGYKNIKALEYIILGAFSFATLYCLNASLLTLGGLLPTTVMTLGLFYNIFLISENRLFRESKSTQTSVNGFKTIIQIICVWTMTLLIIPLIITHSFGESIQSTGSFRIIGLLLFITFSFLGIYSAAIMVKTGKGTPLPLDQTQKLVTTGPYKFVRNPMAVAGIGQGISLSLILTSIHVFAYTLLGALLWQLVVRPIEEKNMSHRFGEDYETYKNNVRCWIPTF